jgi:spermidine synthase
MARDAQQRGDAIVHAYQFPEGAMVADVGGGEGTLLARVLAANPSLRGVLIDQPHVVATAPSVLQAAGVADRCAVQAGDFFAVLPPADVYMLSWILHDWSDADALRILERCREALRPNGSLLLVESVVPAGNGPHPSKMGDLTMLLFNGGGRERTAAEWRTLLAEAGFALQHVIPTMLPQSLLEARPLDRPA